MRKYAKVNRAHFSGNFMNRKSTLICALFMDRKYMRMHILTFPIHQRTLYSISDLIIRQIALQPFAQDSCEKCGFSVLFLDTKSER